VLNVDSAGKVRDILADATPSASVWISYLFAMFYLFVAAVGDSAAPLRLLSILLVLASAIGLKLVSGN
jgi:hypothetical protein